MQITAPTSNAAAHEFAVVLEVEREQGLRLAHVTTKLEQALALCGVGNKVVVWNRGLRACTKTDATMRPGR